MSMMTPPAWRRYLRFWGTNVAQDVDEELRFHLDMRTREYMTRGLPESEARRLAERRFGDADAARTECVTIDEKFANQAGRRLMFATVVQDVAFATRIIRRQLLPAVSAAVCVALGIAATTTMFSVANTMLLRPLPYPNGDRLVTVGAARAGDRATAPGVISHLDYLDWRARQHTFAGLGAAGEWRFVVLHGRAGQAGQAQIVDGALTSANLFRVLGVTPTVGRLFDESEEGPNARPVMLVSHGLAEREFGGDRQALGQFLRVSGTQREIVGVISDQWRYPSRGDLWIPIDWDPLREQRGNRNLLVLGLLPPNGSVDAARRDMASISASLAREYPESDAGRVTTVTPLRELYVGDARGGLYAMLLAAVLVLAVACANVAALQLARATARSREIAVRSAIGASRGRIVGQLLTESVLLAVVGGLAGCGLAAWGRDIAARAVIGTGPAWMTFDLDLRALAFAVVVSTVTGIIFGVAPALRLARQDQGRVLRGNSMSDGRARLQRGFVIAELSLSIVLIVGASLALESVRRIQAIPLGIDPTGVLTFRVSFQAAKYDDHPDARGQFIAALADRLRALPGVAAASAVSLPPVDGCCSQYSAYVEGFPTERGHAPMITGMIITPGYFRTMGIHLVAGRDFNDADTRSAPPVTVINERFARTYWPGGNALGHHVNTGAGNAAIVGIVNDIKQDGLLQAPEPQFYRPYAEDPWTTMTMTVRVQRGDPMRLVPDIRRIMRTLDPAVPIFNVATMRAIVDRRTVSSRVFGELLTVFACIALILAATGVYATMAFAVAQRTRELGLRLALGAAPTRLTSLVLRQSLLMALAGGTIGLASGTFAARALAHTLYGVDATEPWGYATAAAVLLVAAIAASYGPARRASAVDPMVALRAE